MQESERDTEEGDEKITDRQRTDEDVGRRSHRAFTRHNINHQTVSNQRQHENNHVYDHKCGFSSGWEFRDVNQRLDVVCIDEFLPGKVVVLQEFLERLRSDLRSGRHLCGGRRRHLAFLIILFTYEEKKYKSSYAVTFSEL